MDTIDSESAREKVENNELGHVSGIWLMVVGFFMRFNKRDRMDRHLKRIFWVLTKLCKAPSKIKLKSFLAN